MNKNLTYEKACKLFRYDESNGKLIRKSTGKEAGTKNTDGYRRVSVNYKLYSVHRVIFLMLYGFTPEHEVDHINGVRDDNRSTNLRHVTNVCNAQNSKLFSSNTSGFTGVTFEKDRNKWKAVIRKSGKCIGLGRYDTAMEAALARLTFEIQCDYFVCNKRNNLVKAIRKEWSTFNVKCLT